MTTPESPSGEPALPPAPAPPPPTVDTGRLFRSSGAEHDEAIDPLMASTAAPARQSAVTGSAAAASAGRSRGSAPDALHSAEPPAPRDTAHADGRTPTTGGLTPAGLWLVLIGVTTLLAIADVIAIPPNSIGWITGIALVAASTYCAIVIRWSDRWLSAIAPPIAFVVATLIAGQLALPSSGSSIIVREVLMILTTLSVNVAWIAGSVIVAAVVVLIRARRA